MKAEATVLEELADELTLLVEWLREKTEPDSTEREFVNGLHRDLYVLERACADAPAGDHAAWIQPFLALAVAKLEFGQQLLEPGLAKRVAQTRQRLEGFLGRNEVTIKLKQAALPLLTPQTLKPEAYAYLERSGALEALRSAELLRGALPELQLAARLLEGLGVHLAMGHGETPGPQDAELRGLAERVAGWLRSQPEVVEHTPEAGSQPEEGMARRVEASQRMPGVPRGAVAAVASPGFSHGESWLGLPVVVVSPGAGKKLVGAVRNLVEGAAPMLRTLLRPQVEVLTKRFYAIVDDPGSEPRATARAALDLVDCVRPVVQEDSAALAPVLHALSEDFGVAESELILSTPGTMLPGGEEVQPLNVFSQEIGVGQIVAILRPGLRLGGELVRPALVQVSQGPPPPGFVDDVLELLGDDPRSEHLRTRIELARCLAAGDAGQALSRELAALSLELRDDELGEAAQRALRVVLDEPPSNLSGVDGWESVRELLDANLERFFEDGDSGVLAVFRLVRPFLQGLRTGLLEGARLRALGESMSALLSLFDEELAELARAWLFGELERLGSEGYEAGGHTRRLVRTAARAIKTFYANQELTLALELTQALQRSGLAVYPGDGELLELCPDPEHMFHRLEATYSGEPRGTVLGEFDPAVAAELGDGDTRETGAISLSLGPQPAVVEWLTGDAFKASRLGSASARLAQDIRDLDRARMLGELKGDAGAERQFAVDVAERITAALQAANWQRSDQDRPGLVKLFDLLREDFRLELLPGYLSYRRLRELGQDRGNAVAIEVVREGSRDIQLRKLGAFYRDELLAPLDMRWCTGPPPAYVAHLRKIPWFSAVLDGKDPGIEIPPGAREAILDFESPDAQSLDGVVVAMSTVVTWLANEQVTLLADFCKHVKNAPGLEFTFFPLPGHVYGQPQLLTAVERADTPDSIRVVRDAGHEDGEAIRVDRIAIFQKGRRLSEEPQATFSLKALPRACDALSEALAPLLKSNHVPAAIKAELRGHVTRLALVSTEEAERAIELNAFKSLLAARLVDPSYPSEPDNPLHGAGAYLASRLESSGVLVIDRFSGFSKVDEALKGKPAEAAEIYDVFCTAGAPELVEVKRPLVSLEGQIIQQAFLLRGVPTGDAEVLDLDQTLMDSLDRLRTWSDGPGALVESALDKKQNQIVPRTVKRIEDSRQKMLQNHAKNKRVLPPDTQRRDLIRFVIDQVHRAEDSLAMLEDKAYRGAFGELVFKDVVFRSMGPYLSKAYNISIDTSVVMGADTQALVGKFKKESGGPKPKLDNGKIYSVVVPCYSQDGVTIRPATVRVGNYD
ncbi:MAG: hypothetical protein KDD82_26615 [Planctomycetes bacterium]|nr:hypothetical protein [Planctomycetota bacterium]